MTDEKIDRIIAERIMGWDAATIRTRFGHGPGGNWSPSTTLAQRAQALASVAGGGEAGADPARPA
jgi:hypothetical protein